MVKLGLKQWLIIIIAAALLIVIVMTARNYLPAVDDSGYEALRAEYSAFKERTAKESEELNTVIEEKEAKIIKIKEEIIEIQRVEVALEQEIREKDTELTALEHEFSLLEDKDEKIFNLETQVGTLKESLALSKDNTIAAKQEASKWKLSYDKQVEITNGLKEDIKAQIALRESCERLNEQLIKSNVIKDKRLAKAEKRNTIMAVVGGIGMGAGIVGILIGAIQ